ncbi:hypothetical protein GCM10027432_04610 [Lysobacter fragariae]
MAISLYPRTTDVMGPSEFLDHAARHVDPESDESIVAAADALAMLSNNRTFLVDFVNDYLRAEVLGSGHGFYSMQSALLGQTEDGIFKLRANFWAPVRTSGRAGEDEAALLSYQLAHDHNFPFLTVGYHGPGYETVIYEYDAQSTTGYPGEQVGLTFLERTTLDCSKVMFFRPSKDIHIQLPPQSFSVSLNLLVHRKDNPLIPQYVFDVKRELITGFVDSIDNLRVKFIEVAGKFHNAEMIDLLRETAREHRCMRTRSTAIRKLLQIDRGDMDRTLALARTLPAHLQPAEPHA